MEVAPGASDTCLFSIYQKSKLYTKYSEIMKLTIQSAKCEFIVNHFLFLPLSAAVCCWCLLQ